MFALKLWLVSKRFTVFGIYQGKAAIPRKRNNDRIGSRLIFTPTISLVKNVFILDSRIPLKMIDPNANDAYPIIGLNCCSPRSHRHLPKNSGRPIEECTPDRGLEPEGSKLYTGVFSGVRFHFSLWEVVWRWVGRFLP